MMHIIECGICGKMKEANLEVLGGNICSDCEAGMVRSHVWDRTYRFYMDKIKHMLAAYAEKQA